MRFLNFVSGTDLFIGFHTNRPLDILKTIQSYLTKTAVKTKPKKKNCVDGHSFKVNGYTSYISYPFLPALLSFMIAHCTYIHTYRKSFYIITAQCIYGSASVSLKKPCDSQVCRASSLSPSVNRHHNERVHIEKNNKPQSYIAALSRLTI